MERWGEGGGVVREINIRFTFVRLSVSLSVTLCRTLLCALINNNQTDQRYEMEGLEREGLEGEGLERKGGRG